jgi:hypothetical protein
VSIESRQTTQLSELVSIVSFNAAIDHDWHDTRLIASSHTVDGTRARQENSLETFFEIHPKKMIDPFD